MEDNNISLDVIQEQEQNVVETSNNTSEIAEANAIKASDNIEEEILKPTKAIATPELVEEWKRWFLSQKFSLDTVDMYHSFIKRYVGYKAIVNQRSVDRFRESHMGTISTSALKSFFKFLVYKKQFSEALLVIRFEKNRQSRKLPKIISPEEVQKIIDGMDSISNKLLTQTLYSLALRIEECLKLTWNDFNWQEWLNNKEDFGKVSLRGTKRDKFRVLPVNASLMKNLYDNHDKKTEKGIPIGNLLFGDTPKFMEFIANKREAEHLTKEQVEARNRKHYLACTKQIYRDLLYRVSEATIGKKISPHVFRHSKAQWLMDNNTPIETIQAFLGHSSISTTQIYAQASGEKIKADLRKLAIVDKEIIK